MTLKQILSELKSWCQNPQTGESLANAVEQMVPRIQQLAHGIQLDLDSKPLEAEFRKLLEGSLIAYQCIEESLVESATGLRQGRVQVVEEEQLYLRGGMGSLRQCTEAIEQWLAAPFMRCPRCGSKNETPDWICADCDLEYLYPDSSPSGTASRQFLSLGPQYVAVYKAYLGVLSGDLPLADLEVPLLALRELLHHGLGMARLSRDPELQGMLRRVEGLSNQALQGVEQMLSTFTTRETGDLNDGWSTIFANAQELQQTMPSLMERLGVKPEPSLQAGGDMVELSE